MIYALISDIHANVLALSSVLADARQCGADQVICLGDVVGYGPEPERAVALIRQAAAVTLAGNHDDAVAGRLDFSDFIDIAGDAVLRHREALPPESIAWLKSLPYVFKGATFACAHGDFTSPESFEYIIGEAEAAANFAARSEQLLFVGHSHVPGIFLTGSSGKIYSLTPADFTLEDGKRYIVNPGSVGYPRTDGNTCESTYVLYDEAERTVTFRHLPFTVRSVMQTGRNPKRIKKRIIAALSIASAFAAGVAAWLLAPEARVETITEVVTNNVAKVVERDVSIVCTDRKASCELQPGAHKVRVQAKLAKGSPAAHLQLLFLDAAGNILWQHEKRWTATRSKKATIRIPSNAARATLSAGRTTGDKAASFSEFAIAPIL